MTRFGYLLMLGLLLAISCRPEDPIQLSTVESNSFFPTYSGSYWDYDDGTHAYIDDEYRVIKHYESYIPTHFYGEFEEPPYEERNTPNYHNPDFISGLVTDYSIIPSGFRGSTYRFFSEFNSSWTGQSTEYVSDIFIVTKRDTSMVVLGDTHAVTVVRTSHEGGPVPQEIQNNPAFWGTYRYYAKDIGLVKTVKRNWQDSTIININLTDYFINN